MSRLLTTLFAVLLALGSVPAAFAADPPTSKPVTVASDWKETIPARQGQTSRSSTGEASNLVYVSKVHNAGQDFYAVGPHWKADVPTGAVMEVSLRVSLDGKTWRPWTRSHDDHSREHISRDGREFGGLLVGDRARYVQYQVKTAPNKQGAWPRVSDVTLTFIDASRGPTTTEARASASSSRQAYGIAKPAVISRSAWGADESYRYDSSGDEKWERSYLQVTKVVIHDTQTRNYDPNPAATVRMIYYYHAVTQGWGDIGYNYLIDQAGNIYEGRYGGENVVGGHVLCYNTGTLGVSAIGNFYSMPPTEELVRSFKRLIAWQVDRVGIAPLGRGVYMRRYTDPLGDVPNILAHGDTTRLAEPARCGNSHTDPGTHLYNRFAEIRNDVAAMLGYTPTPNPQITGVSLTPTSVEAGQKLRVDVTIQNNGTGLMETQGPNPSTVYVETDTFESRGFVKVSGKFRFVVDGSANATGMPAPYRWGLGAPLLPGKSRTVTGYVQLNTTGTSTYWIGLNQEWVRAVVTKTGETSVTVVPSGTTQPNEVVISDLQATPPAVSPNGDGVAESTVINYRLSLAQDSKVDLLTARGTLVKSLRPLGPTTTELQSVPMTATYVDQTTGQETQLPEGQYKVQIVARNSANVEKTAELIVPVDVTAPRVSAVKRNPYNISPNGDGAQDLSYLSGTFSEPVAWTTEILSSSGALVNRYTGSGTGLGSRWDGKDATGQVVANGDYTYRVSYTDSAGNLGLPVEGRIRVDTTQPVISGTQSSGTGPYTLTYNLSEQAYVAVTVTNGAGQPVATIPRALLKAGRNTVAWDGRLSDGSEAPDGTYSWDLYVTDLAANKAVAYPTVQPFMIDRLSPTASAIRVAPLNISPNDDSVQDFTYITGRFTERVNWVLDITSSRSGDVRRYTGTGSTLTVRWDGRNAANTLVANSEYGYRLSYVDMVGKPGPSAAAIGIRVDTTQPAVSSLTPSGTGPYTLSYSVSEWVLCRVEITDSVGNVVATIPTARLKGKTTVTWDGVRSDGTSAEPGAYDWNVYAVDFAGNKSATYPARATFVIGDKTQ